MDILICTAKDSEAWLEGMRRCLPEARVHCGESAPPCDYAVVWRPPARLLLAQPSLKALFSLGAGVDGLLADSALPAGVPLVRMEDAGMAEQMVEYALYVALREFRCMREYADQQARAEWGPLQPRSRSDYRITVLGLGALGGPVATALAAFGFQVHGWSRRSRTLPGIRCHHGEAGLQRALDGCDVAMALLPLTAQTRHLFDRARIARLPPGAVLVNLSRGGLIDERALLAALDAGHVAAAYLDVFDREPLDPGHPFWRHARVFVTPHVAALTDPAQACRQVAEKIRMLEAGLPITGVVQPARGY